jgi:hypothetical protein
MVVHKQFRTDTLDADRVHGSEFLTVLTRLIGADETRRCLGKICNLEALYHTFHDQITNIEALAAYVYSTANGWHSSAARVPMSQHLLKS